MSNGGLIAIVDDDEFVLELTECLIGSLGYDAITFSSAERFLEWKSSHRASCLITDIQMPGMSGFDLLDCLNLQGSDMPVIVVSAFLSEANQSRAFNRGALGCLPKPYREEYLIKYLDIAMKTPPPLRQGG